MSLATDALFTAFVGSAQVHATTALGASYDAALAAMTVALAVGAAARVHAETA